MFLEQDKPTIAKEKANVFGKQSEIKDPNSNIFVLLGGIIIIFLIFAISYILFFQKSPESNLPLQNKITATSSMGKFPDDTNVISSDEYDLGTSTDRLIAENVSFGYFYEKPESIYDSNLVNYKLPINIKTDVKNYYDASRKINLDSYLNDLNNYGFAVLDKQTEIKTDDFFTAYHDLANNNLPFIITDDFILYYYQNVFKDVYKEIEKNVFYDHVWRLNKSLFDIALTRYKKTEVEMGSDNNPVLEGQRLQLAYFAMALKLLMPTKEQIIEDNSFSDSNKFTVQEADKFGLVIPDFLQADIEREYNLILLANKIEKSPIMLYPINYKKFIIPDNYRSNAKLSNFFITLQWLKNVFPLYYKTPACENCLLDKDDWSINLYAAGRTAKDLYENQDLKNQWAIIYKFISFFSGLRQDITYLNYHDAFQSVFGKNYSLEKIFSIENPDREANLQIIQNKISELNFSKIEGGIDRNTTANTPIIGMRLLQDDFWPNDYIFKELSQESIKANFTKNTTMTENTACGSKKGFMYRCSGFGYDIINLIQPIENGNDYFVANTDYIGYPERIEELRKEMGYFNKNTWNNNVYWLTLDIIKTIINNNSQTKPIYTQNNKWQEEKNYQTALGSWVNLHLSDDEIIPYSGNESTGKSLGQYNNACNYNNYIEINLEFLDELIARNVMLIKMLGILKVDKDTNAASLKLKDLNVEMQKLSVIAKKLANNQIINDDDCRIINDFARRNVIVKKAIKNFSVKSTDKPSIHKIDKVKILALIYNKNNEKIIVFGPMFDYAE